MAGRIGAWSLGLVLLSATLPLSGGAQSQAAPIVLAADSAPHTHAVALAAHVKKPSASFSFSTDSPNAGAAVTVSYSVSNAKGYKVYLQRTFGTSSVYKNVVKLSSASGQRTVSIKAPAMGVYKFRIRMAKSKAYTSTAKKLYSYGSVSLATLLDSTHTTTVTAGGHTFVAVWWDDFYSNERTAMTLAASACKQVHLDLALRASSKPMHLTSYTADRDPVALDLQPNTTSSLTADITRGTSWSLAASGSGDLIFFNGYGLCTSSKAGQIDLP